MKRRAVVIAALFSALSLAGCGSDDEEVLLVMAAASLSDAFAEIEAGFERDNPNIDVELNLAGSSALREQILQGAPADVFASANSTTMDAVVAAGLAEMPRAFATNELTIAVPVGNPGGVSGVGDLADSALLIGLCSQGVPCGDFARQALHQIGVTPSIDTNEGDVRALLTKLAAGELDAGVVYATDASASTDVEAIALPPDADVAIIYPIAVLTDSADIDASTTFVDFVLSDHGQAILASYGFGAP